MIVFRNCLLLVFTTTTTLALFFLLASSLLVDATPSASRNKRLRREASPSTEDPSDIVVLGDRTADAAPTTTSSSANNVGRRNKTDKTVVTSIDEDETASASSSSSSSENNAIPVAEDSSRDTSNPNLVASKQDPHEKKIEAGSLHHQHSHSHKENLPHDHPLMTPSTHPDAAFQADHRPKSEKLNVDDKSKAMSDIVDAQKEKRVVEKQRHPAASQQFVELHGQRVSVAALQQMCDNLKNDHLPFLRRVSSRELELSVLFAANRVGSLFDSIIAEKRYFGADQISCPHGIQVAISPEADKLFSTMQELVKEQEGIRLHLLDLADAWTMTQSKDSDLVEEVVASLSYYSALTRVGNPLNQKLAFLRSSGSVMAKNCQEMIVELSKLVRQVPEAVPNWTHMRVGAEMLIHQCGLEPSLSGDL